MENNSTTSQTATNCFINCYNTFAVHQAPELIPVAVMSGIALVGGLIQTVYIANEIVTDMLFEQSEDDKVEKQEKRGHQWNTLKKGMGASGLALLGAGVMLAFELHNQSPRVANRSLISKCDRICLHPKN